MMKSWLFSILVYGFRIDPKVMSNQQLLDRARYFMSREDLMQAVKLLKLTKGPVKRFVIIFSFICNL